MEYKCILDNFKDVIGNIQTDIPEVDITEIPVSPSLIEDDGIEVFLMPEISDEYSKML